MYWWKKQSCFQDCRNVAQKPGLLSEKVGHRILGLTEKETAPEARALVIKDSEL